MNFLLLPFFSPDFLTSHPCLLIFLHFDIEFVFNDLSLPFQIPVLILHVQSHLLHSLLESLFIAKKTFYHRNLLLNPFHHFLFDLVCIARGLFTGALYGDLGLLLFLDPELFKNFKCLGLLFLFNFQLYQSLPNSGEGFL